MTDKWPKSFLIQSTRFVHIGMALLSGVCRLVQGRSFGKQIFKRRLWVRSAQIGSDSATWHRADGPSVAVLLEMMCGFLAFLWGAASFLFMTKPHDASSRPIELGPFGYRRIRLKSTGVLSLVFRSAGRTQITCQTSPPCDLREGRLVL